jgi:hypothetical protein
MQAVYLCRQLLGSADGAADGAAAESIPIFGDYTDITVQFPPNARRPSGAVSIKFTMRGEVDLYSWWWA